MKKYEHSALRIWRGLLRHVIYVVACLACALGVQSALATPTFQAAGTAVGAKGAVSPAWPTHITDDIALLFVESTGGQPVSLSTAAGFVPVANSPQAFGVLATGTQLTVFWARATSAAMAAPTVAGPGDHVYAQIITYRNVLRTGIPWDVTAGGFKALASTALVVTGVTTTVADTLIVQAASRDDSSSAAEFSALTNATLTSITKRADGGTTQGNGGGFAVWDGRLAASGATGNTAAIIATSGVNAFLTIALKPAPLVINSATLNGAASVTVVNGSSITAVVNATVFAGSQWRSTGWRIAGSPPGAVTCVDHPNHDTAGNFVETFTVTAPSTTGTYDVYFIGYTDDVCSANPSSALLLSGAVVTQPYVELNSTGGTTTTDGLHFYIEETTKVQVRRANNSGQVYAPGAVPPSTSLDNGIFIRTNNVVYGPSHTVGAAFTPGGGMYSTYSVTPASPANPSSSGVQQTAAGAFGITGGPQVAVLWKYTTPLDFITAEVTLTIPAGSASVAAPLRYYHVFDTYLGGSDQGCGVKYIDSNGKLVVGTYPPTSGTTCLSSTSLPAGASVVESFRERTGTFSFYCSADWSSFFFADGNNCSVLQTATMSNTIVTTYRDTGIGIEYDFTAPGTYTFSYDFVIGSPNVPPYDHLEIQHDGSGTLCPKNIKVLACTSSTLPCPIGNIVNTGTLTGSITTTPTSPTVTKSATISIGSSPSVQTISLQAASAGTVTLGSTGLMSGGVASVPLSGTKCWNTATSTQSCVMTFIGTPCVNGYECLETSLSYNNLITTPSARNPLYTKLSGTNFKFDVVALQSDGTQATSYTAAANVTVELFVDTASPAPLCAAYTSPVASQAISFTAADSGRKTLSTNINLPNAYTKLRCRVTDSNLTPTVYGCSSDDFAVRPAAFLVSQNTPNLNAGATLTLQASAVQSDLSSLTTAYTGTPTLNVGQFSGAPAFTSTALVPQVLPAASAGVSSGTFTYDEVGSFTLPATSPGTYGASDSTFTAVDVVSSTVSDCVQGSASNTADASGKYGCLIGQSAALTVGRFYPDHFDFTPIFAPGCTAGGFTYMDQPFLVGYTVTAKSLARGSPNPPGNTALKLYSGGKLNIAALNGTTDLVGRLLPAVANPLSPTWVNGVTTATASNYTFTRPTTTVADATWGPYDALNIGVAVDDADGRGYGSVTNFTAATPTTCTLASTSECRKYASLAAGTTRMRYGRVQLQNAYGSEYLALPLPMALQYWNGNWVTNPLDTCTAIAPNQFAWDFLPAGVAGRPNNLAACNSALTVTGVAPNYTVNLSAPGAGRSGWSGISLNLGAVAAGNQCVAVGGAGGAAATASAPWLQFNWTGAGPVNPTGRATFGVYRSPLIYRRENY